MAEDIRKQVKFDYIKSNSFRVVHADGAWGGVTPSQNIFMALYSQRAPIPQQTSHEVLTGGQLGSEIRDQRVARDAIIREVEVGVQMDLGVARALVDWLHEKIEVLEKLTSEQSVPGSKEPESEPKGPVTERE
jgi:hypothetical protein